MKQLLVFIMMLLSASFVYAQDIITLRTGETINAKVSEVGINEVRYFKSSNINGPVYVAAKADISQIVYENGNKDVFNATTANYSNCTATSNCLCRTASSQKKLLEQRLVVSCCR
jgi:hypothetical protein